MSIMLRENIGWPPGGIQFQDPKVPSMKWDEPGDSLRDVVSKVVQFRVANPRIYDPVTDVKSLLFDFVKQEVAAVNCARLGNDSKYCYDTDWKPEVPKSLSQKCSCGVPLEPRYCQTCGSNRVIGYLCPKCKTQFE